jgi:hypothetical protein
MTKKTFVDKNGNSWEWEETPEVIKALAELHSLINEKKESNAN